MKPIEFPEQNVVFAKDQKDFKALPAFADKREVISHWQMTWRERLAVLFGGRLWVRQLTFGKAPMGLLLGTEYPFVTTSSTKEE